MSKMLMEKTAMRGIDKAITRAHRREDIDKVRRLVNEYESKSGKTLVSAFGDYPGQSFRQKKIPGISRDTADSVAAELYTKSLRGANLRNKPQDRAIRRESYFTK